MSYGSLMCSYKPSLEECGYSVNKLELTGYGKMLILVNSRIRCPSVSSKAASFFHVVFEKCHKAFSGRIVNSFKPDSAKAFSPFVFDCNSHDSFARCSSPARSWLFASNVCLVKLNYAGKRFSVRKNHSLAEFMQNSPGGFVAAKPKSSLQSFGAASVFLPNNPPCGHKPDPKRNSGVLKYCSGFYRRALITNTAHHVSTSCLPMFGPFTFWAEKSIRPPDTGKILGAGFFRLKKLIKLKDVFWVVFHLDTLPVVCTAVKETPQ